MGKLPNPPVFNAEETPKYDFTHKLDVKLVEKLLFFLSKHGSRHNYDEFTVGNAYFTEKTMKAYTELIREQSSKDYYFLNCSFPEVREFTDKTKVFDIINIGERTAPVWTLL